MGEIDEQPLLERMNTNWLLIYIHNYICNICTILYILYVYAYMIYTIYIYYIYNIYNFSLIPSISYHERNENQTRNVLSLSSSKICTHQIEQKQ